MPKREKRTFLEFAHELLDEDKIDNFLDFVQFLKDNQLVKENQISKTKSTSYSTMIHYTKGISGKICALNLTDIKSYKPDGGWSIMPNNLFFRDYDKYVAAEKLKAFILDSTRIKKCRGCEVNRGFGGTIEWVSNNLTVFGEDFSNICNIRFRNPSGEMLERAKELILITKNIIVDKLEGEKQCLNKI